MNDGQKLGAVVLSILLIAAGGFTALSAAKGATDGMNGENGDEGDSVFSEAVTISFAGITVEVGPPMDNDGDGVYEDLNGDGELTVLDAVLHAVVVTAVEKGQLDLTNDQADAVDVDRDGDVDYDDATALARMAFAADGGEEMTTEDSEDETETTTETSEETTEEETTEETTTETTEETTEETTTEETTETTTETPEETTETTTTEDSTNDLPPQSGGANDPYDCGDFDSQQQAQDYYENNNPDEDPSGLDADDDGEACEETDY